jgi:cytochrome c oxidase subunit 2
MNAAAGTGNGWTLQHALSPSGPQAAQIGDLWGFTLVLCTIVGVIVVAAFLYAVLRAPRARDDTPPLTVSRESERRITRVVTLSIVATIVGLFALAVGSFVTDRALASLPMSDPLTIEVTGQQWWWEARYEDPDPSRTFTTANEIHIPVGRPVLLKLRSTDVIHSFWVPRLHGKQDMIPGRISTMRIRADEAGVYRGQCAEFCGWQHALMAFMLVAESREDYERWADAQRGSAIAPADDPARRGQRVFLEGTCVMCHRIQGTDAGARLGPDLTHVGSRATLAAGTLDNDPASLKRWIEDPQSIKPGSNMPANKLPPDDMDALVAYLTSLK